MFKTLTDRLAYWRRALPVAPARSVHGDNQARRFSVVFRTIGAVVLAAALALATHRLSQLQGVLDPTRLLATLAGTAAMLCVGRAAISGSLRAAGMSLVAGVSIFALSVISLGSGVTWLAAAWGLHGLSAAVDARLARERSTRSLTTLWAAYSLTMAILL